MLFGSEVNISRGFLFYLQPEGLKSAYRKKAKETHPDLFSRYAPHVQKMQASRFRDVVRAYDIVSQFFQQREDGLWRVSSGGHNTRRYSKEQQPGKSNKHTYAKTSEKTFFPRTVPSLPLQIGHYLYYRDLITYQALIDAIIWQRKQRPMIGDIALRWRWLDSAAIDRIVRAKKGLGRFGERAIILGLLTAFQVKTLLYSQYTQQERLGAFFVKQNILTREVVDALVRELQEHNAHVQRVAVRRNAHA